MPNIKKKVGRVKVYSRWAEADAGLAIGSKSAIRSFED